MKATRHDIANAKTLSQLEALAKRCGYDFGWAQKIHQARLRKNDRSKRSGTTCSTVVQEAQNQNPQDERAGEQRVARQAYLHSHYSALD